MSSNERNEFSASASALGYFYQCRYALLDALKRLPDGTPFNVYIETLDDVVFETHGKPVELLQTKHKLNQAANLTDASTDLWKSLRIWMEGTTSGKISKDSRFFLITTAACGVGSAASYLCWGTDRNVTKAIQHLDGTASTSSNPVNEPAYSLYRLLGGAEKLQLIERIAVLDSQPNIATLDDELRKAIFYAVERKFLTHFLDRLEGWWCKRAIKHLLDEGASPILSNEIEAESQLLREQFKEDNLPVDAEIMEASIDATGYQDRTFVHQLKLIGISDARILYAIKNYFRSFEQRSRWVREDLLLVGELDRYERSLKEEWEINFLQMQDELGDDSVEEAKIEKAKELYKWVESGAHRPIRSGLSEQSIARGTYQVLSDCQRVGWHTEFVQRLAAIIPKGTGAP